MRTRPVARALVVVATAALGTGAGPLLATRDGVGLRRLALTAQSPEAEWRVLSAAVEADLTAGDGAADVTIRYELLTPTVARGADHGPVFVELLGFGDATVDRFSVDDVGDVELWPTVGSHRSGAIRLPGAGGAGRTELALRYRVEGAIVEDGSGGVRAAVPIVVGPGAPAGPDEGGFRARLLVPEDWTLSEGFPSGLRREGDAYVATLPVVPAMVAFRGRSDGAGGPGFPVFIDGLVFAILLTFSWFGWRHLRTVAAAARAGDSGLAGPGGPGSVGSGEPEGAA